MEEYIPVAQQAVRAAQWSPRRLEDSLLMLTELAEMGFGLELIGDRLLLNMGGESICAADAHDWVVVHPSGHVETKNTREFKRDFKEK